MSDNDRSIRTNISETFFQENYQIKDGRKRPLVNLYFSYADRNQPVYGTAYFMHGYGGSPVEPCMKLPMQSALARGFDVVAIEGVALSATCGNEKKLSEMTLPRQKKALLEGIKYCEANYKLCGDYKVAWPHSMSCRALADLMVYSEDVRSFFNELVLNNPYFLPPSKVRELKDKIFKKDPSGELWRSLVRKSTVQRRQIENVDYKVPTCLYNLEIPVPAKWTASLSDESNLAIEFSKFIQAPIIFVLGTGDDMAEYSQNCKFFEALKVDKKELYPVEGANHSFENALGTYNQTANLIFEQIKAERTQFITR